MHARHICVSGSFGTGRSHTDTPLAAAITHILDLALVVTCSLAPYPCISLIVTPIAHTLKHSLCAYPPSCLQGHHGDKGAARANVILPGTAYTEKAGTYVNFEGRVQATRAAVPPIGDSREDWKILRAVSEVVGKPLPYDTREQLLARLADVAPHLARKASVEAPVWLNGQYVKALGDKAAAAPGAGMLRTTIDNFFMTDAISRASQTMAKCVQARQQQQALKA